MGLNLSTNYILPGQKFRNEHCNKTFTNENANDSDTLSKIKEDFGKVSGWDEEKLGMVEECFEVIKKNPNMTLTLINGERRSHCNYNFAVKLDNKTKNITYTLMRYPDSIYYSNDQGIRMESNNGERPYVFTHSSHIRNFDFEARL